MPTKLYKLGFDISICYTIGAFLLKYCGGISVHAGGYLVLLFTALLSILLYRKKYLKITAMILLPAGYLVLFTPSIPELVLFLLIWTYYAFLIFTERFVINRDKFIDILRRLAFLFIPLAFVMIIGTQKFVLSMYTACPYLTASLISAVLILRHLRAENYMKQIKLYGRQQFVELIIFILICLLLTLAQALQNLAKGLKLAYMYLLRPLLMFIVNIIGMLIFVIVNLFLRLIAFLSNNKEIQSVDLGTDQAADKILNIKENLEGNAEWIMPFLYSIGIIAGLLIVYYFFRWLMGEKFRQKLPADIMEIRETIDDDTDNRSSFKKKRPKDPGEAVRFYYWKFLSWLKYKKIPLRHQDTTEEINDKYIRVLTEDDKINKDASQQLKHLYRRSRYQMAEPITSKEAEKAKKLYKALRASKIPKIH